MKSLEPSQSTDGAHLQIENQIQSLIDGDLDPQCRKKLLLNIDGDHSEYWRYVALGFVEQQILNIALVDKKNARPIEQADHFTQITPYTARHWALAACVTFCLFAGVWWMGSQSRSTPSTVESLAAKAKTEPTTPSTLNIQSALDTGGSPFAMNVPVYDAMKDESSALTHLNASAKSLRKAQDMLHQRGYATSTNTQFITADLKDGRQLVVPINHIVFQQTPESLNTQQPEL